MSKKITRAIGFDIDGTLTELGSLKIPDFVTEALNELPLDFALGLCSGRGRHHVESKLRTIIQASKNPKEQIQRWYFFPENGSEGYRYNPESMEFERFFESPWPKDLMSQEALKKKIKGHIDHAVMMPSRDHIVLVRLPWWTYLFRRKKLPMYSNALAAKLHKLLKKEELSGKIQVLDSGIGVVLMPGNSGKDQAMKRWLEYLKLAKKDLVVIGDQALPGKNDEAFLSGEFGTPYTVGNYQEGLKASPVLNEEGVPLKGPKATTELIRQLGINGSK